MVFDPANTPHLKPWLVRTLEPICDAEPGALADYILALLRHNAPEVEMRKELFVQLEEFLEKECGPFVDTLFTALRTQSYLPYSTAPSSPPSSSKSRDDGIPIPLDAMEPTSPSGRTRKRSLSDDDRDGRPSKGPRIGNDGYVGGRQDWNRQGGFNVPFGRPQQGYQPPGQKRGICRDYHNNGYCARGVTCKYSHGDDAVVPNQLFPMNGQGLPLPFLPMFNGAMPFMMNGGGYDPAESRMDTRPRSQYRAPLLPRGADDSATTSGELPVIQDLTPREGGPSGSTGAGTSVPVASDDVEMPVIPPGMIPYPMMDPGAFGPFPVPGEDVDMSAYGGMMMPPVAGRGHHRGGRARRGVGGGRGTFSSAPSENGARPERRSDKTLVVEKIPNEHLSLPKIKEWFSRFGTVTEAAVDPHGAKALVSFATNDEARAAWKSEDAVFGNRFVKVFWHRPMEGHGSVGQRMLAASSRTLASLSTASNSASSLASTSAVTPPPATKKPPTSVLSSKQNELEKKIAEQKELMGSLDSASGIDEKKEILGKLRKLGEEVKELTAAVAEAMAMATKKPPPDEEMEEKTDSAEGGETASELKAKLEKLKAEAASLGLDSSTQPPYGTSSYRGSYPYRARGRGAPRGYFRGATVLRGGPPRGSMKLDNRPKKLLVTGVKEDDLQKLKDWYEPTGGLEGVERAPEGGEPDAWVVSFKSRGAAEQGLARGTNLPLVGIADVQASWYAGAAKASTASVPKTDESDPMNGGDDFSHVHHDHDDDEASPVGWGGDGDGDGMGM